MATCSALEIGSASAPGFPGRGIELARPIVLVLALLTGLVFSQITAVVATDTASVAMPSAGKAERVRAFYAGMNRYLASGDDAFLELLSPGFQDFESLDGTAGSSATLLARLDAMRQYAFQPRFSIETLDDLGSLFEVRLSAMKPATLDAAGVTATLELPPTTREFVQLERDAILARWSQDDLIPLVGHTLDARVLIEAGDAVMFRLSKVTLESGAWLEWPGETPFGVLMERGSVTLLAGASSQRLASGHDRWVDPAGRVRVSNLETGPSVFWLVMIGIIRANYAEADGMFSWPTIPGVTIEQLVRCTPYAWPANPTGLRMRIARVSLPPGTHLMASRPGMGEALGILDGVIDVTVTEGVARHRGGDDLNISVNDRASIIAGEGIVALHDVVASYRVAGATPATFFVITAVPTSG